MVRVQFEFSIYNLKMMKYRHIRYLVTGTSKLASFMRELPRKKRF